MVGALAGALWLVFVAVGVCVFIKRYRQGFQVAITSDGLMMHMPGLSDDLIPWSDIAGASVKERPTSKPQIATVVLRSKKKTVEIGGVANVFPRLADVERFVQQVNERLDPPDVKRSLCFSPRRGSDDAIDARR
jgi:hypothetical protein